MHLGSLTHEHEALCVRDDLRSVKSLLEVAVHLHQLSESPRKIVDSLDELLLVALEGLTSWGSDDLRRPHTFLLDGGQTSSKDSFADEGHGHALVERIDGGPLAGTLLSGGIEDFQDNGDAVLVVEAEDITGDLDQERVQNAILPL